MRSGKLRERIQIQVQSTTKDAYGQRLNTWTLLEELWASKEETPGDEVFASAARNGRVPTLFSTRRRTDLTLSPSMRVVHDSRVFNIKSIVYRSLTETLLVCEELVEVTP